MKVCSSLSILDALNPQDTAKWTALWSSWPLREVQAHPGYTALFTDYKSSAVCAALESDEGCVLYPLILRDLSAEPYFCSGGACAMDVVTPYGYGGPFCWGDGDLGQLSRRFWDSFSGWARDTNVVSEFVRFTLFKDKVLEYPGEQEVKSQNIVRDLNLSEEEIWSDFDTAIRTSVRKAQQNGVTVEFDFTGERVDDFLRVYYDTMDRREALESYYFPRTFFETIHRELQGQFLYAHAIYEGKCISSELVLVSAENIYSFLQGTDREMFSLHPNDLLRYEIIRWALKENKKRYVLGGGYKDGDGIFRHKRDLAPKGHQPFYVGKRVLNPDLYYRLVESRKTYENRNGRQWEPGPDYFPAYRA